MFDVGFSELLLLAVVALVVIGPERLPHAARMAGAWVGKIKRTLGNMQAEIEREVSAQEMRERLEKEIALVREHDALSGVTEEPLVALRQNLDEARAALSPVETGQPLSPPAPSLLPPVTGSAPAALATSEAATPAAAAAAPAAATTASPDSPPSPTAVDGEAAYREWLAAQKSRNLTPPAATGSEPGHHD